MRWLSRLLIIFVIALMAITLPAAPAQAQGAEITLIPSSGVPGIEITVRGYNFTANEWVDIYYYVDTINRIRVKEVQANRAGNFTVKFTIPESYKGAHTVLAEDEEDKSASEDFTVEPGLIVSPEEGPVGTNVTIKGVGFAKNERNIEVRYYLNGNHTTVASNISANATGSWQYSFQIPPSATGSHRIDAKGESSRFTDVTDAIFRVIPGISLSQSSGSPGDTITMTGSGFAANERDIKILFDGQIASTEIIRADATGSWRASFVVPERPKGAYSVTADGEQTKKKDITARSFEIKPGLVLSPNEGHVGMNLTVTGGGFATNKAVEIVYEDEVVATSETDIKGSFRVSFLVPESQHGARTVTATDAVGNNATAIFTMESDAPGRPELMSPADGSRVGFVGRIRPTFEWSEVEDVSGVYYTLQIARSQNVTTTGFAHPVVSVPRIVGTNYTLNATQALSYGTYYWIVQAVDRAGNAGNWSAVYSFRAGFMPLWGFILAVIGGVAIIGTVVYYFVIRKRIYYY